MNRLSRWLIGLPAAAFTALSGNALAEWGLNLTQGVTPTSKDVFQLHMLILWICVAIGVVVFGAIAYSIINHRKSKGHGASEFHESAAVEAVWTVIPFLILVGMAIPATRTLLAMEDTSNPDMTVKITGYQWKWRYEYLDDGIDFYSNLDQVSNDARRLGSGVDPASVEHYLLDVDNRVVLPTNTRIRFVITAADVIHAWWIPQFGWKKDAIPGFVNEAWTYIDEPGVYRGQCAELCGKDHGFMPIVVEAVPPEQYNEWVQGRKAAVVTEDSEADKVWTDEALAAKGETVYNAHCGACHQPDGQGLPGTFPPIAGGAIATGPMQGHLDIVMNGKSGTAMAAFRDQLSDADLAAVITYQRNAFGNSTGDAVQPTEIKAAR